eukprot:6186052-Pleurochrysis_carterae.AAC.1
MRTHSNSCTRECGGYVPQECGGYVPQECGGYVAQDTCTRASDIRMLYPVQAHLLQPRTGLISHASRLRRKPRWIVDVFSAGVVWCVCSRVPSRTVHALVTKSLPGVVHRTYAVSCATAAPATFSVFIVLRSWHRSKPLLSAKPEDRLSKMRGLHAGS